MDDIIHYNKNQIHCNAYFVVFVKARINTVLLNLILILMYHQKKVTSNNNQIVYQDYFVSVIDHFKQK
jgi:hypothetical protein